MEEQARSKSKDGRIPPHDDVAEKSLLGALIINNDVLPEILTIVKPRDFYDERHQIIFDAILNLYDNHKPVDLLTLSSELKSRKQLDKIGKASYLAELSNFVPAASHAKAYAELIEKASTRRRLINAGTKIAERAFQDDANPDELICSAEQELFEVSDKIVKSDYVSIDQLLADAFDRIDDLHKNKGS